MNILKTLVPCAALLLSASAQGQLAFGGHPYGDKAEKRGMEPAIAVHLPAVDVPALLAEDASRAANGIKGPFRFGFTHHVQFNLANNGSWWTAPNGDRVWRLMLHCPGALAINLGFDQFDIPTGAAMYLYNEAGAVRGGFTAKSAPGHHGFGTVPLSGDRITVEYVEPANVQGQGTLQINAVTHDYRDLNGREDREFGASGTCNVNTICPQGDPWRDQIRSVAHVILGGGVCSGTLLNNCANDSTPYFLTANHCTEGNTNYGAWVFVFNWESPVCDPTEDAPMDDAITGCDMLVENPPTDMAFLRLSSIPPVDFNAFYGGWDKSGTFPDSVTCIHHPSGDIKKISSSHGPLTQQNIDVGNGPADCWHIPEWYSGTTEPGSSGSGLWNQDKRIIGQLYGGSAECGNSVDDFFGRFDLSYPLLAEWLGACGDTLDGFDPNAIIPVPQNTAITSIFNVEHNICNVDSIHPIATLKNDGEEDLHTVFINYTLDGVAMGSQPWTGILHINQTTNVQLPWLQISGGQHELKVFTSEPNGLVDDDLTNDMDSLEFLMSAPGEIVTLSLQLDHYGSETTWKLETDDGFLVTNGGPYTNDPEGYVVTVPMCLSHVCYTFTIMDGSGDGICCDFGEGHYTISDSADYVYVSGNGQFTEEHSDMFCVSQVGVEEHGDPLLLHVFPNPNNGRFTVLMPSSGHSVRFDVHDALGRTVWSTTESGASDRITLDTGDLAPGSYVLVAEADHVRSVQRIVVRH